jgi:branched-chain amino acid transport system permease protein
MLLIAWSILRGPLGRAFVAVRESETAAAAMGVNVARTKVTAFTISAVYAGVAGAVLTLLLGVMTPESVDITTSINFLTAIVIGGLASILGSIIGGIVLVLLPSEAPELVAKLPLISEDTVNQAPGAILGLSVIAVVLLMPYGMSGAYHRLASMQPAQLAAAFRGIPNGIRSRIREMRENIRWWQEDLPWNRPE